MDSDAAACGICRLRCRYVLWLTIGETRAIASAQQASLDALSGAFQTRTEHAGLIKAFRAIGRETAFVRAASESLRDGTMRVLRIAFLSTAVLEFFSAISIALIAVYVGFKLLGLFPVRDRGGSDAAGGHDGADPCSGILRADPTFVVASP
jgi:ABC-type transport system involved in cytochrome bd biosynthesis fused ATPase/permease subunit